MNNWEERIEAAKATVIFVSGINQLIANAPISWGCKEGIIRRRESMLREFERLAKALETYDPIYLGM